MSSRRAQFHDYYAGRSAAVLLAKSASAANRYAFRGAAVAHAVVVRADLNGYSDWSRDRPIGERVTLLNDFFAVAVPALERNCGIYFRDEGDCVVAIFSDYFGLACTYESVATFCQAISSQQYGKNRLTAKCVVACGNVAFFQKGNEVGTDDWSAEGEPFVRAARLEAAIERKARIYYFAHEYDRHFASGTNYAKPGDKYYWTVNRESLQVQGLGLAGGWVDTVNFEHAPEGRVKAA
jgi:class 3 adenylate cyclase